MCCTTSEVLTVRCGAMMVEICRHFGRTCCIHLQDIRLSVLYCDFKEYMVLIYYFIISSYDKDIFLLQLHTWIWNSANEIYKE